MIDNELYQFSSDQSKNQKKSVRRKTRVAQFEFPPDQFQYRKWKSLKQIVYYFQQNTPLEWKYSRKMYTAKSYKIPQKDYHRLVIQCKICHSQILVNYWENQSKIQLKKFSNKHQHIIDWRARKQQQQMVGEYLKNLPPSQRIQNYVKIIMEKFGLDRNRVQYLLGKFIGKASQNLTTVMNRIRVQASAKVRLWYTGQGISSRENMVLMVTKSMSESYQKYGDCLCFDITYRLVRKDRFYNQKKQMQQQQWGTGFFIGQDTNFRVILFGVALIKEQTSDNIQKLFNAFFSIMKGKMPQTIVTDQQASITKALSDIKSKNNYQWLHLLDWFHKLQTLKRLMIKRRVDKDNRGDLLRGYSKLMRQTNPIIFNQLVQGLREYPDQCQILDKFLQEKHRYCTSQIGPKFFGFSVSSARAQAFNNIIKSYIPMSTHLSRFFSQTLRCQKNLCYRESQIKRFKQISVVQNVFDSIIGLINKLEDRVYEKLIESISKLRYMQFQENVREMGTQSARKCFIIERGFLFNVEYDETVDFWFCQCNVTFQTGIPCIHILMVLQKFNFPIQSYIKPRWIRIGEQFKKNEKQPTEKMLAIDQQLLKQQISKCQQTEPKRYGASNYCQRLIKTRKVRQQMYLKSENKCV